MLDRIRAYRRVYRSLAEEAPCALCGERSGRTRLYRDRYLLPVDVRTCSSCGHTYCGRSMSEADEQAFYRDAYRYFYEAVERIDAAYVFESRDRLKAAFRLARIREELGTIESVLEIGCGLGFFLDEARRAGARQIHGVEPGSTFHDFLENELGLGAVVSREPIVSEIACPFDPQLVVLFHVLEHMREPRHLLELIRRAIRADGLLVLEVPEASGFHRTDMGVFHFHFGHRHYFTAQRLERLLRRVGFDVVRTDRSFDDGIYPSNLRVFARPVPPSAPDDGVPSVEGGEDTDPSRGWNALSLRNGYPRAALRLVRRLIA